MKPVLSSGSSPRKRQTYTVRCSNCGYRNPPQYQYCDACKSPLVVDRLTHHLGQLWGRFPPSAVIGVGIVICLVGAAIVVGSSLPLPLFPAATPSPTPTQRPTETPRPTRPPRPTATPLPTPTPTASPTPVPQAIVQVSGLNVREGPGTTYAIVATVPNANEALTVLGQAQGQPWVKVQLADASQGWVSAQPEHVRLTVDKESLPVTLFRPKTGFLQAASAMAGRGELTIKNGTSEDYVVIVSRDQTVVAAAYLRQGENYTLTGMPDGTYDLYTSSGTDWDGYRFRRNAQYQKVDKSVNFVTGFSTYTTWTYSLQPMFGGNTTSTDVTAADVPPLQPRSAEVAP